MKKLIVGLLMLLLLAASGCSSGSSTATPQERLAKAVEMMGKGYDMAVAQKEEIQKEIDRAKDLMKSGQNDKASELLNKVLAELELIAEADRFNKSE